MFSFHIKEHMSIEHIHNSGVKMILIMPIAPFIFSLCSLGFYLCWQCINSTSRILFQSTYFLSKQQDSLRCCTPNRQKWYHRSTGCWQPESPVTGDETLWNWWVVRDYCRPAKQDVKKHSQLFARWQTGWKYLVWNGHSHSHSNM